MPVKKAQASKVKPVAKVKGASSLTLSSLKVLDKSNDKLKTINVKGYDIKINEVFRDTAIQNMLNDFLHIHMQLRELEIDTAQMDFHGIMFGLILKNFSDLPIPEKFEDMMDYIAMMIDNGFLTEVIAAYEPSQYQKLIKAMEQARENSKTISEYNESQKESAE